MARYEKDDPPTGWYWCHSHLRWATHILIRDDGTKEHHCDPNLAGILLPCKTTDMTPKDIDKCC